MLGLALALGLGKILQVLFRHRPGRAVGVALPGIAAFDPIGALAPLMASDATAAAQLQRRKNALLPAT